MSCPICGGPSALLLIHSNWEHHQCSECGHVFLSNPPSQSDLATFYSSTENAHWNTNAFAMLQSYRQNPSALRRYYQRDRARHLNGILREGAAVLDIGCGSGVFLATLRDAGMRVTGHDISTRSTEAGRAELGVNLVSGPLDALEGPFDVITSYDVIEHWVNPRELVESIRRLCHKGTTIVIRTPNHGSWLRAVTGRKWLWYMPPAHIHLFTAMSLCRLLKQHGFDVIDVRTGASSYVFFAAHYLAGSLVAPGDYSLDIPRWKEAAIYGADRLLRLALAPLLIPSARRRGNPLLEVHARLQP